jgi:hypothetical protein
MTSYTINYNTDAGNTTVADSDVDNVLRVADAGAGYTQKPIDIYDDHGNCVATRRWIGCNDGVGDQTNPIRYGDLGYYADWQLYD